MKQLDNRQTLEETWTLMPHGLEHVDTISGQKLYSSKDLRTKVIDVLYKQKLLTPVIEKIESLIERQIILPCFTSSNLIGLIKHKIFSKYPEKYTAGFFNSKTNKIYIMLDNHLSKYLNILDKVGLSEVTIHELQHYCCYNLKSKYYNIQKDSFRKFFSMFYKLMWNINVPHNIIDTFVVFALKNFELSSNPGISFLSRYAVLLDDQLSKIIKNNSIKEENIIDLLSPVKIYLTNDEAFISMLTRGDKKIKKVIISLLKSYESLGIKSPNTIAIQELVFPSEICAIESQYKPKRSHYTAIEAI